MADNTSATIKINLPAGILANARQEAERIGISVQDFIRMLMATYFSRAESIQAVSRDRVLWERGKKEVAGGKFVAVEDAQELERLLLRW